MFINLNKGEETVTVVQWQQRSTSVLEVLCIIVCCIPLVNIFCTNFYSLDTLFNNLFCVCDR